MEAYKTAFIRLALSRNVLRFGEFTLKSGRLSPYFFNAGLFCDGQSLRELGQYYAETLLAHAIPFEHLFGPAYKGLPLATATAIALAERNVPTSVTFNRKETKDHGEGGVLIGAPLSGNTVMIDDVITAGTAFRESRQLIAANGGHLTGVVIALNRCERGAGAQSTLQEIEAQGIQVASVISFFDLVEYLDANGEHGRKEALLAYHAEYGVS